MNRSRRTFLLLVVLVLTMSFTVPAEDVGETAYDESESLPFDRTLAVFAAPLESIENVPAVRPRAYRLLRSFPKALESNSSDLRTELLRRICPSIVTLDHSLRC